jgi:hypothetical protein
VKLVPLLAQVVTLWKIQWERRGGGGKKEDCGVTSHRAVVEVLVVVVVVVVVMQAPEETSWQTARIASQPGHVFDKSSLKPIVS